MKMRAALGTVISILLLTANPASADEDPAAIAGDTGCDILASLLKNPQLAVAAGRACHYGTNLSKDAVGTIIDKYFDSEDQKFANKYCLTIIHADGTKIQPTDKTSCSN